MDKLLQEDLMWCLRRCPKDVRKLLKERSNKLFIAGGFIRSCIANERISDIDIFSPSDEASDLCALVLKREYYNTVKTDNAITVYGKGRMTVQFIYKWTFEKPEDVLPSFDFTIAKAIIWYDGVNWQSLCDDRFYKDLAAKRLVYCSPTRIEEVGGSMLRVLKFYQRGYRIPLDSLGAVIARCVTGINFEELHGSSEEDYAFVLTGLLREVDPLIDPEHISHLPATVDNNKTE